jgi:hypothetical protein
MTEAEILARTHRRLGSRRDVRLWRQNTGVGLTLDGERMTRFGVKGGGDLSGIVRGGTRLEVETKSARGRQSPQQKAFGAMIQSFGGIYIVAHSDDEAEEKLEAELARHRAAPAFTLPPDTRQACIEHGDGDWVEHVDALRREHIELYERMLAADRERLKVIRAKPVRDAADMRMVRLLEESITHCEQELEEQRRYASENP